MAVRTIKLRTLEVEEETLETLDLLAEWQSLSRQQVIQSLLREGARQARLEYVAGLYGRDEVTLERAAEMAGVTIYDMMAYVRTRGVTPPADPAAIRVDVASMLVRLEQADLAARVLQAE